MKNATLEPLPQFQDDRGWLTQLFDKNSKWKRAYLVSNWSKHSVRAHHLNIGEEKGYIVLKGAAKFNLWTPDEVGEAVTISDKKPEILIVPGDIWHGWIALEEGTILMGLSTASMEEHKEKRTPWDAFGGEQQWLVQNR